MLVHLALDGATIYTANHLDAVPPLLNAALHRLLIGTMVCAIYLFYQYIAILVEEETGKPRRLDLAARIFLALALFGAFLLPISYVETPQGSYSAGPYAVVSYAGVAFYLVLCAVLLFGNWRSLDRKKRFAIGAALVIEFTVCALQGLHHTWLISGMGLTLMTLAFYLTLENPDILRGELTEQKLSMLYLKSQVNPHFLYNTLDAIRIQAQLDGDKPVADLLMQLVDFFRLSVKVDRPMVTLDDELELLEAYLELMCVRYPELQCDYDVDPELGGAQVPNFILQPIVENSLLHGLKDKGYRGRVAIAARKLDGGAMKVTVCDSGSGFAPGKRAEIDALVPDIVIMDINIPIMNGLKVIELARMKHPDMAFVVVSGYDDFSYCREALRQKITDYILKPVNYEEFGACIDNLKIARFQKTVTEAPPEQGERTITGLTRYLQAHLAEDISLGMLSDEFHLSAQYISQLFKSEIGVMFILMSLLCRHGAELSGTERA